MPQFFVCAATIVLVWSSTVPGVAQVDKARSLVSHDSMVTDQTLGISFLKIGLAARHEENAYRMSMQSPGGKISLATAAVSVSLRPFVDLSGSYGGRLYLDEPSAKSLLTNRMIADTVDVGGLRFRREFWAVYAGMGMWEGVINCYAYQNHQYYILSLNADVTLGKPGEVLDGERVSAELLRTRMAETLNDSREPAIQQFNELVSSFQISK